MRSHVFECYHEQRGFTLVELLVGMAIGLALTAVILQVMSVYETQNRTTVGVSDAQTNGGIALYTIARDLKMAGYSLLPDTNSGFECATLTVGGTGIAGVAPIVVTNGAVSTGVNASDTLTIRYGDSMKGGVFTQITASAVGNDVPVTNSLGCRVNDVAILVNGTNCTLTRVTGPADLNTTPAVASQTKVTIAEIGTIAAVAAAVSPGVSLACLGSWNEITYRVNGGNLERNNVPILTGIINLQAQYGISASANSNTVTGWVNATSPWDAPTVADRNRIKAVRLAVIARSDKMEATNVSAACSSTTDASPTGLCAWAGSSTSPAPAVDLSPADANWRRYRYRVFETVIPLRNVVWAKETL